MPSRGGISRASGGPKAHAEEGDETFIRVQNKRVLVDWNLFASDEGVEDKPDETVGTGRILGVKNSEKGQVYVIDKHLSGTGTKSISTTLSGATISVENFSDRRVISKIIWAKSGKWEGESAELVVCEVSFLGGKGGSRGLKEAQILVQVDRPEMNDSPSSRRVSRNDRDPRIVRYVPKSIKRGHYAADLHLTTGKEDHVGFTAGANGGTAIPVELGATVSTTNTTESQVSGRRDRWYEVQVNDEGAEGRPSHILHIRITENENTQSGLENQLRIGFVVVPSAAF